MPDRPPLPPGPFLVVGLGRSGRAAARTLISEGHEAVGCDSGTPAVDVRGLEAHTAVDGVELLDGVATVVKSPGVPADAPVLREARRRGIEIVGELEIAWRLLPNRVVAVTGTNGKTTTVELLGAIWRAAGLPAAVAGNVGRPLSDVADEVARDVTVICEASSFQLEDSAAFAPEVAVLLNVEEDHLDRHGDVAAYRAAKARIFANQARGDRAVTPPGLRPEGRAGWVGFGHDAASGAHVADGWIAFGRERLLPVEQLRLRGAHNLDNALAATAAALADWPGRRAAEASGGRRVAPEHVAEALRTFPGVEHRLEEVATVDGVLYVNDSKATNPASAVRGLEAFAGGVHAILGGSVKGGGFAALRAAAEARCRACYLIGDAADRIAADLDGAAPLHRCETLERAVERASAASGRGDVVLLSPACASFDAFRDYEHRGERFKRLVAALAER